MGHRCVAAVFISLFIVTLSDITKKRLKICLFVWTHRSNFLADLCEDCLNYQYVKNVEIMPISASKLILILFALCKFEKQ